MWGSDSHLKIWVNNHFLKECLNSIYLCLACHLHPWVVISMLKIIIFFESTNPRYNLSVWNTEGKYFLLVCSFHILMLFFFHTSTSSFYYKYNSAAFHEVRYLQLFIVCYMQPYFHNEKLFSFVRNSSDYSRSPILLRLFGQCFDTSSFLNILWENLFG